MFRWLFDVAWSRGIQWIAVVDDAKATSYFSPRRHLRSRDPDPIAAVSPSPSAFPAHRSARKPSHTAPGLRRAALRSDLDPATGTQRRRLTSCVPMDMMAEHGRPETCTRTLLFRYRPKRELLRRPPRLSCTVRTARGAVRVSRREGAEIMLEQPTARIFLVRYFEKPYGRGVNFQIEVADVASLYAIVEASPWPVFLELEDKSYRHEELAFGNGSS